jgi:hypothetical protein
MAAQQQGLLTAGTASDLAQRIRAVRAQSLERARIHVQFIEERIALRSPVRKPLSFAELAAICFQTAKAVPDGEAAKRLRQQGLAYGDRVMAATGRGSGG